MRRPYNALDRMRSAGKLLAVLTLAQASALGDWSSSEPSSDSSSENSSGWSSSSSDSGMQGESFSDHIFSAQLALVLSAREPFDRKGITWAIGPERYSFARIERDWGTTTTTKAVFRFDLPGLRQLKTALRFPDEIHVQRMDRRSACFRRSRAAAPQSSRAAAPQS